MSAKILDGKNIANTIKLKLCREVSIMKRRPGLAAILIGNDQASEIYINLKEKACKDVGINFHKYLCNNQCCQKDDEKEIIEMIKFLNRDKEVDGILVQLPLPANFSTAKILGAINPKKDVDGFIREDNKLVPPTIAAILELLQAVNRDLSRKKTLLLTNSDTFTKNLTKHLRKFGLKNITHKNKIPNSGLRSFDIVISALGESQIIKKPMIKKDAIVIDVGISREADKIVGDVDPAVGEVAGYLSPVPGGVGPLTVACLLRNVYLLAKK